MSDEAIKRLIIDAKARAKKKFNALGYDIINSDNKLFCFIASRAGIYERKIRVVVGDIQKIEIEQMLSVRILPNQTKEIWCWKIDDRKWKTIEYDHLNNSCQ